MKKGLLLLYLGILFFLVGSVAADLTTDIGSYYKMEAAVYPLIDSVGNINMTNTSGSPNPVAGKINFGQDYTISNDVGGDDRYEEQNLTWNMWINMDDDATAKVLFSKFASTTGNKRQYMVTAEADETIEVRVGYNAGANQEIWDLTEKFNTGTWEMVTCTWDHTAKNWTIYLNGTYLNSHVFSNGMGSGSNKFQVGDSGDYVALPSNHFEGVIDEVGIWTRVLNASEILDLYNSGSGFQYPFVAGAQPNITVNFTAKNRFTSAVINSFNVALEWSNGTFQNETTTTGGVYLDLGPHNSSLSLNATFYNASNYFNETYENVVLPANASTVYEGNLTPFFYLGAITYGSYVSYSGVNYTRNLSYSVNVSCASWSTTNVSLLNNSVVGGSQLVSCNNDSQLVSGYFQAPTEGVKNITVYVSTDVGTSAYGGMQDFTYDLYAPSVNYNFTVSEGFDDHATNVSLRCYDTIAPLLTYNSTFNSVLLYYGNESNNTVVSNITTLVDGSNVQAGYCKDFFSNTSFFESTTVYSKLLCLIDEKENTYFDADNITLARVYFDDNSSYFTFNQSHPCANFTGIGTEKLRFQLEYLSGDVITRYVDVTLPTGDIRVCANKEGTTHYEQLIISATQQPVIMRSVFSDCLVAADYTRFAYQDSFLLKAYTISALYYLYTYDDDSQVLLASVDGSVSTYMNLDTLEFAKRTYNLDITGDGLAFEKTAATEMMIYYHNIDNDNENVSIVISNADTGTVYLSTSELTSPNNFTIYFNWATLSVTNETLFKVQMTTTDEDGNQAVIKRYFNALASSGYIQSSIALAVAILLTIFGLTFTATRITLSWFGIGILLLSIGVLSFAISAWYITLMLVINVIVLIYIIIVTINQNYPTISG